jgi:hypothetical protein
MKRNYHFPRLSRSEREFLEMVFLEEVEAQSWFSVACTSLLGEVFLTLQ